MINTLLPTFIDKNTAPYSAVENLGETLKQAFEDKDISNIAVTGPFGSGKSSVLKTLMRDYPGEGKTRYNYLQISLATLKGNNPLDDNTDKPEGVNRKIEYSIVQQLTYREKTDMVRNSGLKRIVHINASQLFRWSISFIAFIVCFFVVFEPSKARVDTFYEYLNFGRFNILFDALAAGWMLFCLYWLFRRLINVCSNLSINKLNVRTGEIEVKENVSLFNKYLSEILYFFQVTDYNVVILEDLDRFSSTYIFLKLRELCKLINDSKIVDRHVVFIYAVRDDLFANEDRTKFFDYITSVIPVINSSNSTDLLRNALGENGISDDDLSEIAFFIQDMRILINIVNEYKQYRRVICEKQKAVIDDAKLLAMIVYKNYHPDDFAKLHKREGKVYACLSKKNDYIKKAQDILKTEEDRIIENRALKEKNQYIAEAEIRYLFLLVLLSKMNIQANAVYVNNQYHALKNVAEDERLFKALLDSNVLVYNDGYRGRTSDQIQGMVKNVEKELDFNNRIKAMKTTDEGIERELREILKAKASMRSLRVSAVIEKYNLQDTEQYKKINLSPLMDVFIRRGYIDEDYCDYISYFYNEMVTESDRYLLLSLKRKIKQDYDYRIDKIEIFIKALKPYMFESDAILNNDLLDYLSANKRDKKIEEFYLMIMRRLETASLPVDFVAQYYQRGKQAKEVMSDVIKWDSAIIWEQFINASDSLTRNVLIEAFLKYCEDDLPKSAQDWLSDNYAFLSRISDAIGEDRCDYIVRTTCFISIEDGNDLLLKTVIENSSYKININNLIIIANHYNHGLSPVKDEEVTLLNLLMINNEPFQKYILDNLGLVVPLLPSSDDNTPEEMLIIIANKEDIAEKDKQDYLSRQKNKISHLSDIDEQYWSIVLSANALSPTWENVYSYYKQKGSFDAILNQYIVDQSSSLGDQECPIEYRKNDFVNALIWGNDFDQNTFENICKSFHTMFSENHNLTGLDNQRMGFLIMNNMIPFTETNTSILASTPVFSQYLIKHARSFIKDLPEGGSYDLDNECLIDLLSSKRFSQTEKRRIICTIDKNSIDISPQLADLILDTIISGGGINYAQEFLDEILVKASNQKKKITVITYLLRMDRLSSNEIDKYLSLVGGLYKDIAGKKKKPVLSPGMINEELLRELTRVHYISSTTKTKEGIRVNPKRK